jgi:hypothetical protein
MNLAQALKQKNRLAGELVRQQQILQRENARRSDSVSKVNRQEVWEKALKLSEQLGELKGKITQANVNIYPALERMAELKARIVFLNGLPKREGDEIAFVGRDQEKLVLEINDLQDEVDAFNAATQIED